MWLFPGISQRFLSGPLPGLVGYHLNLSKEGAKWGGKMQAWGGRETCFGIPVLHDLTRSLALLLP